MSNSKMDGENEKRSPIPIGMVRIGLYKYISIKQVNFEVFEDKPVYRIFNNKTRQQLGIISWYKPWKQYVFSSIEGCVFNNTCLKDVLEFLETL